MTSSSSSEYKAKCLAIPLNVDVCEQEIGSILSLEREKRASSASSKEFGCLRYYHAKQVLKLYLFMDRLTARLFIYILFLECMIWSAGFPSLLKRAEGTEGLL